jgi:hypothetical protein
MRFVVAPTRTRADSSNHQISYGNLDPFGSVGYASTMAAGFRPASNQEIGSKV